MITLALLGLVEESCRYYAIVEFPVHEGGCDDGDEAHKGKILFYVSI